MRLEIDPKLGLIIAGAPTNFTSLSPWLNGAAPAEGGWEQVGRDDQDAEFIWRLGDGSAFRLVAKKIGARFELRYTFENFPPEQPLLRFGFRIGCVGPVRAFLRNGYFSWDGSYFVRTDDETAAKRVVGYAMTQLLQQKGQAVVLGFDRHETFQQLFTFDRGGTELTIETCWDAKVRPENGNAVSETLIIFATDDVESGLREWARLLGENSSRPPRLAASRIRGWCSWYNLYAAISDSVILEHLQGVQTVAQSDDLPMEVFQIDDGFTPEMGDWLDVKPQFPRGMKPLLDDIRSAGFKPGLWIAPFMVGNRSRLFRDHPDWVVRERGTGRPLAHMKFYAEFRWHKRSEEYYILDTTRPAAMEYLREVFRTWAQEWGCDYFKTDFMHFGSEYGPDQAQWHVAGMTRIEIWRQTAIMIRETIGEALWLGCGCPLWASVGLVDGVRIGRDVGVEWKGNHSAESLLRDQATRNFAHGILWQSDPDCILLREKFHALTDREVRALALYAGMSGGVAMTSDALDELSPQRIALWRQILDFSSAACRFPRLGRQTASGKFESVIVQVRPAEAEDSFVFIFNAGEEPQRREFPLVELGFKGANELRLLSDESESPPFPATEIKVSLEPHEGVLFRVSPRS